MAVVLGVAQSIVTAAIVIVALRFFNNRSGAITDWPFHQLRLMGYAVFLLVLTVPALEWLLGR